MAKKIKRLLVSKFSSFELLIRTGGLLVHNSISIIVLCRRAFVEHFGLVFNIMISEEITLSHFIPKYLECPTL